MSVRLSREPKASEKSETPRACSVRRSGKSVGPAEAEIRRMLENLGERRGARDLPGAVAWSGVETVVGEEGGPSSVEADFVLV